MKAEANSAFEHNFSEPISNQAPFTQRENLFFPINSQVKPATGVFASGTVARHAVLPYIQKLQISVQQVLFDPATRLRLAGHLMVLVVAAIILLFSQLKLPAWQMTPNILWQDIQANGGIAHIERTGDPTGLAPQESALQRAVIPNTLVTQPKAASASSTIESYIVKPGDTVLAIAAKYGINPETILWANPAIEQDPDKLAVGDQLTILPVNGVLHVIKPGDTLSALADQYKVTVATIMGYQLNQVTMATAALTVGRALVIPGGVKLLVQPQYANLATISPAPDKPSIGRGNFSWPVGGDISQTYWGGHPALDISSWTGNTVKAPDSGYVAVASSGAWNTGYGNYIIIDHGNGFTTLYAHLSSIFVKPGENVTRGEQIGMIGTTGRSTGPHLHFEIRYQGVQRNPISYLP